MLERGGMLWTGSGVEQGPGGPGSEGDLNFGQDRC